MKTTQLEVGKWYKTDSDEVLQAVRIKKNRWDEMSVFMNDGRHYSYEHDFDMFEETQQPIIESSFNLVAIDKKPKDERYYTLKLQHQSLCDKKALLYKQGKNKNMRVAYINQELEMLREQLREY